MDSAQAVTRTIEALEACDIEYMVVGAFSSNIYGVPRSTRDADIVVRPGDKTLAGVIQLLGDDYTFDRQLRLEGFTGSLRNDLLHIPTGFRFELFRLGKDKHHQVRFDRRLQMNLPTLGVTAWVPTAEDVVIQKLRWARPKDREDVSDVLLIQGDRLDFEYVRHWTDLHGTTELLEELRPS